MSVSFQVCRVKVTSVFAVRSFCSAEQSQRFKNDGKPVRNMVRTSNRLPRLTSSAFLHCFAGIQKVTQIATEIKIATNLLEKKQV